MFLYVPSSTQVRSMIVASSSLALVVLPVVVKSSLMAKYFIYIGGHLDSPSHILLGVVLPWVIGALVNHLQIYSYLINWTALITSMYVQFVCPMFMWAKACKEAEIYENNFKCSMQIVLAHNGLKEPSAGPKYLEDGESSVMNTGEANEIGIRELRTDGVPSIDNSSKKIYRRDDFGVPPRGIPSSKFLMNSSCGDEDDDNGDYVGDGERLSNITEAFYDEGDNKRFTRVYNM